MELRHDTLTRSEHHDVCSARRDERLGTMPMDAAPRLSEPLTRLRQRITLRCVHISCHHCLLYLDVAGNRAESCFCSCLGRRLPSGLVGYSCANMRLVLCDAPRCFTFAQNLLMFDSGANQPQQTVINDAQITPSDLMAQLVEREFAMVRTYQRSKR